jgi:hypothetical protein
VTYRNQLADVISACFDDVNVGWALTGSDVKRTTDGGATWTTSFTNPAADEGDKVWSGPLECKGADVAWLSLADGAAAGHRAYLVFRTIDGGVHWQPVMQAPMGPSLGVHVGIGAGPGPISVVDADNAFVVGSCGPCVDRISPFPSAIEATHDGGLTWDPPAEIVGAAISRSP